MRPLKRIRRHVVFIFLRIIIWIVGILPRFAAVALGTGLGRLAAIIFKKDRKKAVRNLELALGDTINSKERELIARNIFVNFGKSAVDVIRFKNHFQNEIAPLVDIEGRENFDKVYNRGKGIIAVTGHIGNFELLAAYMGSLGYKVAAIGREIYDQAP